MDIEAIQKMIASMNVSGADPVDGAQMTENSPSSSSVHKFSSKIGDLNVFYLLSKLGSASFLWVGGQDGAFHDLCLSSPTQYDRNSMPSTTKIFGNMGNIESSSLAGKLAKKLNKPFYVSFNLLGSDIRFLPEIDSRIFEELSIHPEKF